ncbi:MAG: twin-arginine translocase TatA/TatE family subunit [Alphaproteobacteria bacterium]|nr:twin-arginine translocase TatA/TatE family subunit [Alphaproteobacteria bacterium]MBN2675559.1 twin-arginine translocase TatA/TatE family subunit [Alphaproteobacteria bacterium]
MRAGFWEILLIVVLILILFGHAKIPDLMKNLANGINVFKKELKSVNEEKKENIKKTVPKKQVVKKKPVSAKTVKKTK